MPEGFNPRFDSSVYERAKKFLESNSINDTPALDATIKKKQEDEQARRQREAAQKQKEQADASKELEKTYDTLGSGIYQVDDYSKPNNSMSLNAMKPAEQSAETIDPKKQAEQIAKETNTTILVTQDSTELIKAMYKMNLAEGGTDLNNKSIEDAIKSYGGKGGVSGAHYSYETLVKAANNNPSTHTPEFKKLIEQLIGEGKVKKTNNGTYSENIKGGGVILSLNNGDPAFLVHEGRHAEASFYDLRSNPETLANAEAIIQNQPLDWKKKALAFFLGKPYWEGLSDPQGMKWDGKEDKGVYVERYLTASQGKILLNPEKRAWMIDEFIAYASDGNNKDILDIPEMKDYAKKKQKKKP